MSSRGTRVCACKGEKGLIKVGEEKAGMWLLLADKSTIKIKNKSGKRE